VSLHPQLKTLKDDLARESFREALELEVKQFNQTFAGLKDWISAREAALSNKETVKSVKDARFHLNNIEVYQKDKTQKDKTNFPAFKKLGEKILAAKYSSDLTSYTYPKAEEIQAHLKFVEENSVAMDNTYNAKLGVLHCDLAREQFAEKLNLSASQHANNAAVLNQWIAEKEAYLKKKEDVHSVQVASVQLNLLSVYASAKADLTTGQLKALKHHGSEILGAEYKGPHSKYIYTAPEEIKDREAAISAKWSELDTLHAGKKAVLEDDLEREKIRERVLLLNEQHLASHQQLKIWIAAKETFLTNEEKINSIQEARFHLNALTAFGKEKEEVTATKLAAFNKLGDEVLSTKYEKLSKYAFEKPDEVKERVSSVAAKWEHLASLSKAKQAILDASLKKEEAKEKARLDFASLGAEITRWSRDVLEAVEVRQFGFSLKDVEATSAKLKTEDSNLNAEITSKQAAISKSASESKELGVTNNPYTTITAESLEETFKAIAAAQAKRQSALNDELVKQRSNDALAKAFADIAVPFKQALTTNKDSVSQSTKTLEEQLKDVDERIKNAETNEGKSLPDIKKAYENCVSAGVQSNPYTLTSWKDIEVQWKQYLDFLVCIFFLFFLFLSFSLLPILFFLPIYSLARRNNSRMVFPRRNSVVLLWPK
jgi:hypothetical protein